MTGQKRTRRLPQRQTGRRAWIAQDAEPPPEEPSDVEPHPPDSDDGSDWEFEELPCTDDDDSRWDVFLPDDEREPDPEPGDFWIE